MNDNYMIPKEYLLLRKEYLTKLLMNMPMIKLGRRGDRSVFRIYDDDHRRYTEVSIKNRKWNKYFDLYNKRTRISNALTITNRMLRKFTHRKSPYSLKVVNYYNRYDSAYFDKLQDSSCTYENVNEYYYNGHSFRSRAEMQFAAVLDEFGLEYKYDVVVSFGGYEHTVDFVVIFREFNRCIFIEYYGRCSDYEYNRNNCSKLLHAQNAGIYLGRDMFIISGDKHYTPGTDIIRVNVAAIIGSLARNHIEVIDTGLNV